MLRLAGKGRVLGFSALAVAIIIPWLLGKPYYIHVATICLFWAYLASAWNIIGGFGGQLSLGHGMFTAMGAYVTVMLFNTFGISPWIGMFAGAGVAVLLSLIIGYPTFSLRGAYFALATVAMSEGLVVLIESTQKIGHMVVGGAEGLSVKLIGNSPLHMQFTSKIPYYYVALALLLVVIFVSRWLMSSRLGYYLIAIREDEEAAAALGINVRATKLAAIAISAFFTALGGAYYAQLIRYLLPVAIAGGTMSTQMVFLAIVGGSGTVAGPVVGGILLTLVSEVIRFFFGDKIMGLHLLIYGLIVVLIIVYKPHGLIEILQGWYSRLVGLHRPRKGE